MERKLEHSGKLLILGNIYVHWRRKQTEILKLKFLATVEIKRYTSVIEDQAVHLSNQDQASNTYEISHQSHHRTPTVHR